MSVNNVIGTYPETPVKASDAVYWHKLAHDDGLLLKRITDRVHILRY